MFKYQKSQIQKPFFERQTNKNVKNHKTQIKYSIPFWEMNKQKEMSNVAEPKNKHFERQICQNTFSIKIAKDAAPSR